MCTHSRWHSKLAKTQEQTTVKTGQSFSSERAALHCVPSAPIEEGDHSVSQIPI